MTSGCYCYRCLSQSGAWHANGDLEMGGDPTRSWVAVRALRGARFSEGRGGCGEKG